MSNGKTSINTPIKHDLSKAKFIVSFISVLQKDAPGYSKAADQMLTAVQRQQGFVGVYSARDQDGVGITVSFWSSLDSIAQWKTNKAHSSIQKKGKKEWYNWYQLQVCEIVRSSDGERSLATEYV